MNHVELLFRLLGPRLTSHPKARRLVGPEAPFWKGWASPIPLGLEGPKECLEHLGDKEFGVSQIGLEGPKGCFERLGGVKLKQVLCGAFSPRLACPGHGHHSAFGQDHLPPLRHPALHAFDGGTYGHHVAQCHSLCHLHE